MDELNEALIRHPLGESWPRAEAYVESRNRVAYNQTNGYILGVEIECGDFTFASLAARMPRLTPKSGAGLWMLPFRGIPATDKSVSLDLLYLGADCRVIEAVEYYPTFSVSSSSPPAASVLALPIHLIESSHTQPGDQLAFGLAEEIERELARPFGVGAPAPAPHEAADAQEEASEAPAPRLEAERASVEAGAPPPAEMPTETQPWRKQDSKPKSWWWRWLFPDPPEPRKTLRAALPDLAAYFWTGGTPQPHAIRNISSTGMYVETEERWYPGTLVQMTLRKAGRDGAGVEASISLLARVNRWGNDGVGLSFLVRDSRTARGGEEDRADAVERKVLDRFLAQAGLSNG
jgi:hypothetical protein